MLNPCANHLQLQAAMELPLILVRMEEGNPWL